MPTVQGFSITLADRVREQTQTTGTGTYSLDGAVSGYRAFQAAITSGQRTGYCCILGSSFEVGIGTVTSGAPATITRDLILRSSNAGNPVSWQPGTKDIFVVAPASLLNQIEPPGAPLPHTHTTSQITDLPGASAHTHTTSQITDLGTVDLSGVIASRKVTVFTNSGTWTRDTKCLGARVRGVGNGGAGGGTAPTGSQGASGGGGAGGEYAEGYFTRTQLTASRVITIPSAALGDTGSGASGGTVGFGSLITFAGGGGGDQGISGVESTPGGLQLASGSGGDVRIDGSAGGRGNVIGAAQISTNYGGASVLGGSAMATFAGDGLNGIKYGGGGAGAGAGPNVGSNTGGDGARGIVIIEEDLSP